MVPNRSLLRVIRNSVHRAIVLARYIVNIPFGPVFNWVSEEGRMNSSFTCTEQKGAFCRGVFRRFLKMS